MKKTLFSEIPYLQGKRIILKALTADDAAALVFEAVYPAALGDMQIGAAVEQMIASMDVMEASGAPADESAEVG